MVTGAGSGTPEEDFEFHLTDIMTSSTALGQTMAEQGLTHYGAVVDGSNAAMAAIEGFVEDGVKKGGGEQVFSESVAATDSDFSAVLTKLQSADVDVLYVGLLEGQNANFLRQMQDIGGLDDIVPVSHSGLSENLPKVAGVDAAEGMTIRPAWAPGLDDEKSAAFEKAFQDKYDNLPNVNPAFGYQTAWIIAEAIRSAAAKGDITGEAVRAAIPAASTSDTVKEHGIIADLSIAADGRTTYPGVLAAFNDTGEIEVVAEG
ncbi:MAG TPA: ABC transporter substrate-binding protein [Propionibacteriaceae bacterium]|nr:ABC transporter substrate-binding protein [Propionibacteriaceae bacterium]